MKKVNKYVIPTLVVLVLILDFLALDDITTGNEPDFSQEWDFLLLSAIFFAIVIWLNWKDIKKWITKKFSKN